MPARPLRRGVRAAVKHGGYPACTRLPWDERFAWHDAGLGSTNLWAELYPALDRSKAKRRL